MAVRRVLPFVPVMVLAACGSNAGGSSPAEESAASALETHDLLTARHSEGGDESEGDERRPRIHHVLLLSVDGLHEVDLATWIAANPTSTLASLAASGVQYTDAHTTTPSDSFPGMTAQLTGATPKTSGVYYDDSYDRTLYPPGSNCAGNPGSEIILDETLDHDNSQLLSGLDPANFPMAKDAAGNCNPVFPHDFIRVNTVFEVVRAAGGHTAWSDKHPAYEMLNGPSGKGIEDLYAPEINSLIVNGGTANGVDLGATLSHCDGVTNSLPLAKVDDYTTCMPAVFGYDDTKVQAIINEIDGLKSDGSAPAPVPNVFGMNFQEVSVGQKLPIGGYADANGTEPTALLESAIAHVDQSIGRMVNELEARGLHRSTLVIVSAKHGQSPIARTELRTEAGGLGTANVVDPIGAVNAVDSNVDAVFTNASGNQYAVGGYLKTDDVGIVWLQNQSPANVSGVVVALESNASAIAADTLPAGTIFTANVTSGSELAAIFGDPASGDSLALARAPNVFIQPNVGVIYSGSKKKIAEHGGGALGDTHVALLVSNPALRGTSVSTHVTTTQIAPTILRALGLPTRALDGVRKEGTRVLPSLPL